jgi:hypothetical protein
MRTALISAALLALSGIGLASVATPAAAQITTVDPNDVIDADLDQPGRAPDSQTPVYPAPPTADEAGYQDESNTAAPAADPAATVSPEAGSDSWVASAPAANAPTPGDADTYQEDDLIGAAEGVFGKGAQGLATMIEDILAKQGRPNGYIVGREAAGAFVLGLRYGSGTLFHKVEGQRTVYWTGPSIGFDAGGNASQTFTLVYNLYDSQDLYKRFPAGEGAAYLVGGFTASYMRRGDVVLIPIRLGVGARLGVNVGYMRFSEKQKWLPF